MEFTNELYEKAKRAKSVAELIEIAKAEHVELTQADAEKYFDSLHKTGELADEELDNVSGGCGENFSNDYMQTTPELIQWQYPVGMVVKVYKGEGTFGMLSDQATIISHEILKVNSDCYYPAYMVQFADGTTTQVMQRYILKS